MTCENYRYASAIYVVPTRVGRCMYTRSFAEIILSTLYRTRCFDWSDISLPSAPLDVQGYGIIEFYSPCLRKRIRTGAVIVNAITVQHMAHAISMSIKYGVPFIPFVRYITEEDREGSCLADNFKPHVYFRYYDRIDDVLQALRS